MVRTPKLASAAQNHATERSSPSVRTAVEAPVIRLRFTGVTHPHGVFVGPAPWFRISGDTIVRGPDGETVARMRDRQWLVRGSVFNRFDCRQPLMLSLEDGAGQTAEAIGQFDECAVVGGTIFGEGAPVATWAQDRRLWRSAESDSAWPVVLIQAGE